MAEFPVELHTILVAEFLVTKCQYPDYPNTYYISLFGRDGVIFIQSWGSVTSFSVCSDFVTRDLVPRDFVTSDLISRAIVTRDLLRGI